MLISLYVRWKNPLIYLRLKLLIFIADFFEKLILFDLTGFITRAKIFLIRNSVCLEKVTEFIS